MKSMTGFGKSEVATETLQVTCEMKSVNQRFLDLQFKMPKECFSLELPFRKMAQDVLSRGRVEVFMQVTQINKLGQQVKLNQELFLSLLEQLKEVEQKAQRDLSASLAGIFQQEDLLTLERIKESEDEITSLAKEAFEKALFHLQETRQAEGDRLLSVLNFKRQEFAEELHNLKMLNREIEASHFERLKEKLSAYLEEVDENRLLTEVAIVVDKGDIHEELDRLQAHLLGMDDLFKQKTPAGRQLDFLLQEMNREVNTIGSKSTDLAIKTHVLQMKAILENCKEQIQNIE